MTQSPETLDSEDVFEINDFTTATEWERFTSRFEQLLSDWNLNIPSDFTLTAGCLGQSETFSVLEDTLMFANFKFLVTRHYYSPAAQNNSKQSSCSRDAVSKAYPRPLEELLFPGNEFPARSHCLVRWFGLSDLIVVQPAVDTAVLTDSQRRLVMSSVAVALNNTGSCVPVFVQANRKWQKFYFGLCETKRFITDFEMVHLKRPPNNQFRYLSELLQLFKEKIASPVPLSGPVSIAVRFLYVLREVNGEDDEDQFDLPTVGDKDIGGHSDAAWTLPFGAVTSRISEIHLAAIWPHMGEDVVVDTESHTDLNPLTAPTWTAKIKSVSSPACRLTLQLSDCLRRSQLKDSTQDALASLNFGDDEAEFLFPTRDSGASSFFQQRAGGLGRAAIPVNLSKRRIQRILEYLFPLSATRSLAETDTASAEAAMLTSTVKGCPKGSFFWRLAPVLSNASQFHSGLGLVAHIWCETISMFRARWETQQFIPFLDPSPSPPNLSRCLLHQKLQMLNCCIAKARERSSSARSARTGHGKVKPSTEEEEFFDCSEEAEGEGRLREIPSHRLIENDSPMYIPVTQEPSPMTEDMLEEHADRLTQLGVDGLGSHLRAQLQSASLQSDMEAFKAANPGALLGDFVRWYSPRDWLLDEGEAEGSAKGKLSQRMNIDGSIWKEVWAQSKPIPAKRQRRLFDDTREALKVLSYFEKLTPGAVLRQLMPVLCLQAIYKIQDLENSPLPLDGMKSTLEKLAQVSRQDGPYHEVMNDIQEAENKITFARSVYEKCATSPGVADEEMRMFVQEIIEEKETPVPGGPRGPIGKRLAFLFFPVPAPSSQTDGKMNRGAVAPEGKEYLLRVKAARPCVTSQESPQRMFCTITSQEFRIAAAFTSDNKFV